MGYLRKMRKNQQSEAPHIYTYEPPFPEILDPPLNVASHLPAHEFLVLIAYEQNSPISGHADVSTVLEVYNLTWVFIYIHTLCMRA